jgi:arylsulfatase A-like enzyme
MLTGLSVEDHGVDWNGMDIGCPPIETPTLLTLAAQAGYRTALVAGKDKFCHFAQDDRTDYYLAPVGDRTSADRVLELLDAGCEVIFAHFPNPDYFGHRNGWMSEVYLYELRNTDAALARVLAKLDELSLTDETLVIVTADHGGHDFEHGSARAEDMTIPWVIAGPGVVPGTTLADIHITDTAVTILWALGLPLPDRAAGRPVLEAFGLASADALTSVAPGDRNRVTV